MGLGEGNAPGWIVPEMDVETVTAAVCGSDLATVRSTACDSVWDRSRQ